MDWNHGIQCTYYIFHHISTLAFSIQRTPVEARINGVLCGFKCSPCFTCTTVILVDISVDNWSWWPNRHLRNCLLLRLKCPLCLSTEFIVPCHIRCIATYHNQDCVIRADSRFAPSQWTTALLCNDISHWLGASLESALVIIFPVVSCRHNLHTVDLLHSNKERQYYWFNHYKMTFGQVISIHTYLRYSNYTDWLIY